MRKWIAPLALVLAGLAVVLWGRYRAQATDLQTLISRNLPGSEPCHWIIERTVGRDARRMDIARQDMLKTAEEQMARIHLTPAGHASLIPLEGEVYTVFLSRQNEEGWKRVNFSLTEAGRVYFFQDNRYLIYQASPGEGEESLFGLVKSLYEHAEDTENKGPASSSPPLASVTYEIRDVEAA